jgi:hypothetical protein
MLWLARDFGTTRGDRIFEGIYAIFCREPKMKGGEWLELNDGGLEIPEAEAPIKLKPGEGPVKVKLVKA